MGVAGFPSTLSAMMGTVVAAYQGLHTYQVVTDFGRYICSYGGAGTGVAGVQHAGGIQAGTYVFILAQPGLGFGAIVGIVDPAWAITTASPNGLVTSPQVSGFQLDTRLVGSLLQQGTIALSSYPSDVGVDLCNGEVGLLAQHGSGAPEFRNRIFPVTVFISEMRYQHQIFRSLHGAGQPIVFRGVRFIGQDHVDGHHLRLHRRQ